MEPLTATGQNNTPINNEAEEPAAFSMDVILNTLRRFWYLIILAAATGGIGAYYYAGSQPYVYQKTASVMMREAKSTTDSSDRILSELGADPGSANLSNETIILKSTALMKQVVETHKLQTTYWTKHGFRYEELYRQSPLLITFTQIHPDRACSLDITPKGDSFTVTYTNTQGEPAEITGTYGQPVTLPFATFTLHPTSHMSEAWNERTIRINHLPCMTVTRSLLAGLTITRGDQKDASMLILTLTASHPAKAEDILNSLIDVYNHASRDARSEAGRKTEAFIRDRLAAIGQELSEVDQQMADKKKADDLLQGADAAMSADFTSSQAIEQELFALETQIKLADKLAQDLNTASTKSGLIAVDTGIADTAIASRIESYNEAYLEYARIAGSAGSRNPKVVALRDQMTATLKAGRAALANFRNNLNIKHDELKTKQKQLATRLSASATHARELTPLIREHKVKEELYLLLLTKEQENALSLAIAEPSARVLEAAYGSDTPIAPKSGMIITGGTLGGGALCLFAIIGISMLNNKVNNKHDLAALAALPVVGELPILTRKERNTPTPFLTNPRSIASECYHIARHNADSLLPRRDQGAKIYMITSTLAGEGKTTTTANLALSFAKANLRVLLIDADLRKRSLTKNFTGQGRKGLTSILLNDVDTPLSIIHHIEGTPLHGVDILYAGPTAPNPVTLLSQPCFRHLLDYLRNQYDIIMVDAPPHPVLADAALIAEHVDSVLYIVRAGRIDKRYFTQVSKLAQTQKLPNLGIIINAVNFRASSYNYYGYGYGSYGYGIKELNQDSNTTAKA